ncbi:uncharacterized protein LOC111031509 [Myzus persicae]|uniref:uncharacterized protein LOC111031509 n=1 Tax=Myzus persicae TaxID=13164 RepID=UPI000B9342F3|nr:uncharacterized protein LOC111031509 [Myzus persicae]
MISTWIFIPAIVMLSVVQCIPYLDKTVTTVFATKPNKSAYVSINNSESPSFITSSAAANGGATKTNMSKSALANNYNKPANPTLDGEEINESDQMKTSVPTKIRHVVSKSIGLCFWPLKESWKIMKHIIPFHQNTNVDQTKTRNEINIQ